MRSVIIGGGVAGCAIAAALRGIPCTRESVMIERRQAHQPAGMGFILMPNGLDALAQIAPEFDWRAAGRTIDRVSLRAHDGAILTEQAIEPACCVSREQFLSMLAQAAGETRTLLGVSLADLERAEDGSTRAVILDDGSRLEGQAFFACDGARSPTRGILFPEAELAPVVVMEIVSIAHSPQLAARLGTTFHKFHDAEGGFAVGMVAESDSRVVWFVQFDARRWTLPNAAASTLERFIRERVQGWSDEIAQAIEATNFDESHLWPTRDLPPMPEISCENLALVGDAAHACLPFTSQGANGALVDALLLRDLLRDVRTPCEVRRAFAEYSDSRRAHHRRMFIEGRRLRAAFLAPLCQCKPVIPLVA